MKFLKVILFSSIFTCLFCILNVSAITNSLFGTEISDSGLFYSLESYPNAQIMGYSIVGSDDTYFSANSSSSFIYGTNGGAISQCGMSFLSGNYYSITYSFITATDNEYIHPFYSAWGSSHSVNVGSSPYILPLYPRLDVSSGIQISSFGSYRIGSFTVIFQSPSTGTCVSIALSSYNHSGSNDNVAFIGYNYENLGQQAPTSTEITNIINNANQQVINNINSSATSIINNSDSNRQAIINNANANNEALIESNTQNTQDMIDSQKSCTFIDKNNIVLDGKYLVSNGNLGTYTIYGVTDYIALNDDATLSVVDTFTQGNGVSACFYNINKEKISCYDINNVSGDINIPGGTSYFRSTINKNNNRPSYKLCKNGNQAINDSINDLNDNINNDNVDANDSQINDLINDSSFQDTTGLSSVINAPLSIVSHLTDTCSPIQLHVPYIDFDLTIPCMSSSVYTKFDNNLILVIKAIINGFLVYRIIVSLYGMIKGFKDPQSDKVEVIDL